MYQELDQEKEKRKVKFLSRRNTQAVTVNQPVCFLTAILRAVRLQVDRHIVNLYGNSSRFLVNLGQPQQELDSLLKKEKSSSCHVETLRL